MCSYMNLLIYSASVPVEGNTPIHTAKNREGYFNLAKVISVAAQ